jgi:N-acetyl-gamma-glutamyl-phosphate reductase
MTDAYIVGGSGYTGGELLRILLRHPKIDGIRISSRQYQGKKVGEVHSNITDDLTFEDFDKKAANDSDFVFLCTPHTKAMEYAVQLDTKIIDLSADFRLKNAKTYEEVYKVKHAAPELIPEAVYGLPELHRGGIKKARIVANPGCLATGAILALWPLVKNYHVDKLIVDSKTGISGAGKKASEKTHFCKVSENLIPYKVSGHRHIAEMEQELGKDIYFTPHIVPMARGIETTVHAFVKGDLEGILDKYREAYGDEAFTKVVEGIPTVLDVRGSNYCHVGGFTEDKDRLVLFSAIDNLVKGASGQAVQNMNIMAGFRETLGLDQLGLSP